MNQKLPEEGWIITTYHTPTMCFPSTTSLLTEGKCHSGLREGK